MVAGDDRIAYRRYVMPNRTEPDDDPAIAACTTYRATLAATDAAKNGDRSAAKNAVKTAGRYLR